ncbi:MAG: tetratricopeptide repeat protein [Vicinamibacterales bacterium]
MAGGKNGDRRGARARKVKPEIGAARATVRRTGIHRLDAAFPLALLLVTAGIYSPAWNGTLLWDDAQHLTQAGLRTLGGLWRIWFEPGATQQYYPLVHTAFWLQHRLWGDATLGYHLVNIALHTCSAFLVALILRRLAVPGAWLAAAIFALHPVQVESVAWMTELKNTLSGALGLGALLAYVGFDRTREKRRYAFALTLFVLALLSKTVTAMLPLMLIAALWWKRGNVSWRHDLLPLTPFVAVGAVAGLTTAWIESTVIGASGSRYDFTTIERGLIAGRAFWFYLFKLVWPSRLVFIYPRWSVSQAAWWQYLYPLTALAVVAAAWAARGRSRAPLAVVAAFSTALFPVLGFFNVYPFRFSFVADHFQYLASIPVIAVFAAGMTRLLYRPSLPRILPLAASVALLLVLASLSLRESHEYVSARTLYEATLRDNPSCWLAHVNLGKDIYDNGGNLEEAIAHFEAALRLEPGLREAHFNLGLALHRMGRLEDAIRSYQEAARIAPGIGETYWNLCTALRMAGRLHEARTVCQRAVELSPDSAHAQFAMGATLHQAGRLEEALESLLRAAQLAPGEAEVFHELGGVLQGLGRLDEAAAALRESLRLQPESPASLANLGYILFRQGRVDEALGLFREAARLHPNDADLRYQLGNALQSAGRLEEAAAAYRESLRLRPGSPSALANLGFVLSGQGRVDEAMRLYREALRLEPRYADAHYYLGNALQSQGLLQEAEEEYRAALALSPADGAVHTNLGLVLEDLDRPDEAASHYREALRHRPDLPQAKEGLERVTRRRR